MSRLRLVFAGNRRIALFCLRALIAAGCAPVGLLLAKGKNAECAEEMKQTVLGIPVVEGVAFRSEEGIRLLRQLEPDYLLCVHFPYIIPAELLTVPALGVLNLHPSYLPYNRGWNTPTWALVDGTPYGATLHWMDEGIDTGDTAVRKAVRVLPCDTAHTLYQRVLKVEEMLFREAIPLLMSRQLPRMSQAETGSSHARGDLESIQRLDLDATEKVGVVLSLLRGLTTSRWEEAAWFEVDGRRYRVRVELRAEE